MPFENNIIIGNTINDVWRDAMWCCVRNGYDYKIEKGSYEGQIRRQLDYVVIRVLEPWTKPLAVNVPEHLNFSSPTSEESIEQYFCHYLLGDTELENQQYTYSQYISKQIYKVINILIKSKGNTNQATIAVGNENSVYLSDPPCLRTIDFKVVNGKLNMSLYFRSWDFVVGLPENLGGLQLAKEYVLMYLKQYFDVEDGEIIAYSSGSHIYSMYFDIVNQLCVDKININK